MCTVEMATCLQQPVLKASGLPINEGCRLKNGRLYVKQAMKVDLSHGCIATHTGQHLARSKDDLANPSPGSWSKSINLRLKNCIIQTTSVWRYRGSHLSAGVCELCWNEPRLWHNAHFHCASDVSDREIHECCHSSEEVCCFLRTNIHTWMFV
jgi:hypothetical protein